MNSPLLNLAVNDSKWDTLLPNAEDLSHKVISLTLKYVKEHQSLAIFSYNKPLSFNLCLSDNKEVHALNKEFRHLDKPTNILSFANIDDPLFEKQIQHEDIIEMGDMIIALETLEKEALQQNISLHNHFCHLLVHGVLHLLGYDHIQEEDAIVMENLEINILQLLNIANPYKE